MKKLLVLLALVPTIASAQMTDFFTGNQLWEKMNEEEATSKMLVLGYIAGVASSFSRTAHCAPANVTLGQVQDVVRAFMQSTPEHRHERAAALILAALINVWPCTKTKGL